MTPRYAHARQPRRASYDEGVIHAIVDRAMVAHVGFIAEGRPMVMPMAFARVGAVVYLHGASKTRIARLDEAPVCLEVTRLTGLVAARSGLHHSVNYESAVIHGTARRVSGAEKARALDAILDHLLPGRSGEVRAMNAQEEKATGVIAITIEHASAKIRNGPPADDIADQDLPIWAGVVPVVTALGQGLRDAFTAEDRPEPPSLAAARRKFA
ncbi:pyridoxamine 5'-phosphate oxidase family protein [Novosphingobium sp. 1949]|uniref:Pyridoxamine 5'-phosphate oxidase family protein n=1 Tax=Novosphingobium organovorum TaxID=2930092 RepID=A0ABT0BIL1_9SPHN|nr:pyridoxamine 5'-phosphate oxidase family protein [Novosphingobium organovorum]MCJ2184770.1 pyridoxamine 5'-phosphate oxidase family protein [Novosphingobium organovorum]